MTEKVFRWIKQEKLIEAGDIVAVGLSGGADSVCLLLVLAELQEKLGCLTAAVHVEHGIRGEESLADAAFVQQLCQKQNIPCLVYHANVPKAAAERGIGMEEAARLLRYDCYRSAAETLQKNSGEFFGEKRIGSCQDEKKEAGASGSRVRIALAHHADDNAETVLFQLIRGSGIDGMGGMRPKRELAEGADIIRPLLFASRSDMEDYLAQRGQAYRTDSTNFDTEYSRNKIRHEILPRMAELNSKAVTHINQSAKWMRQAAEYLEKQTKAAERDCCVKENGAWLIAAERFFTYDELIRTELIHRLLAETAGSSKDIGSVHVAEVIALFSKQNGRQMTLPYGITAKKVYEGVRLSRTQEPVFADETEVDCLTPVMRRRLESGETVVITVQNARFFLKILVFSGEIGQIEKKKYTKWLDYDKIKGRLRIRKRQAGDYLTVDGMGHRKKLKDYFINEKIPQEARGQIWLLAEDAHVLWVVGGRISACCKAGQDTKRILEVRFEQEK